MKTKYFLLVTEAFWFSSSTTSIYFKSWEERVPWSARSEKSLVSVDRRNIFTKFLIMLQYHLKHPILLLQSRTESNWKPYILCFYFSFFLGHLTWARSLETDIQYTGTFSEINITGDLVRKQSLCPCQVHLTQEMLIENKCEDVDGQSNIWMWTDAELTVCWRSRAAIWTASHREVTV